MTPEARYEQFRADMEEAGFTVRDSHGSVQHCRG
jgi:hypothetical protein